MKERCLCYRGFFLPVKLIHWARAILQLWFRRWKMWSSQPHCNFQSLNCSTMQVKDFLCCFPVISAVFGNAKYHVFAVFWCSNPNTQENHDRVPVNCNIAWKLPVIRFWIHVFSKIREHQFLGFLLTDVCNFKVTTLPIFDILSSIGQATTNTWNSFLSWFQFVNPYYWQTL